MTLALITVNILNQCNPSFNQTVSGAVYVLYLVCKVAEKCKSICKGSVKVIASPDASV